MKDSWGPLKALTVASVINGFGDIFLCCFCGYGIAGAAWATMISQVLHLFSWNTSYSEPFETKNSFQISISMYMSPVPLHIAKINA